MQTNFIYKRDDGQVYNLMENGGFMAYKPEIELPILQVDRKPVLGRDSSLTYNLGTYGDRKIVVPIFFLDWEQVRKFRRMFNGTTGKLYFNYKDTYYKVTEVNSIFIRDAKGVPEIDINLMISPFAFKEEVKVILTQNRNEFINYGDIKSKCIIKIYGTGDCSIDINNALYNIKGLDGYITLNSNTLQIYKDTTNANKKVLGEITKLNIIPDKNVIIKTGNITKIELSYIPNFFE